MSDKKVTDLTEVTTPADNDWLYLVDVSDTADNSAGSSRKSQVSNVVKDRILRVHGATGDGVADDTTEFQAALTAGGRVYLPAGYTFLVSSDVTMASGSVLEGEGTLLLSSSAELIVNSNCTVTGIKIQLDSSHRGDWMDVASRSNVTIDGIFFDGNRAAIGALSDTADKSRAHFNTSTNFKVVNSRFTGSNGTILRIEDCDHFNVSDNLFDDSPGLTANGGNTTQTNAAVYTQRCDNFVISDNQVDFIDDNAFALIGPRYATVTGNSVMDCRLLCAVHDDAAQDCKKVSITGNVAIGCENGILIGWFDSPTNYPCQDVVIDGNYLHAGTTDRGTAWTKKYGIIYYNTATNIVISDNVIESRLSCIAASTSEYANLPTDSVTKILYSGNKLTCAIDDDSYPNCVITDDGAQDCMWIGNHLETSGTTPSGTIRMILGGDNDIFIGNTVIAHSGYNDSLFKAGSVVTNNLFDTKGVVAGSAAYQLLNNVFQNSATINETGTAVTISGNFGGTTVENQIVVDNRKIAIGSGSPESSKSAFIGSLYLNKTGGAGTSLYVKESGTGNTGWVPVLTQQAYGEMHINANSTATTVSVSDTWYQVTAGWATGDVSNVTFSTDELQADIAGEYMVTVSASMTGAAGDTFSFVIAKNDTVDVDTLIERKTGSADVGAMALTGIFSLAATDAITLWGKNQAGTNNFTITEATLTLVRIG